MDTLLQPPPLRASPPAASARGAAVFSGQAWAAISRGLGLTERELQVLRGLFDNQLELAIADELGISRRTVHTHVERLHRKLGVNSRAQLFTRVIAEFLRQTLTPSSGLPAICANSTTGHCPCTGSPFGPVGPEVSCQPLPDRGTPGNAPDTRV